MERIKRILFGNLLRYNLTDWLVEWLTHCKEIFIYEFPEKELRSLSPNFHIYVPVSDLYIPTFGPPSFFLLHNRQTDRGNI